MGLGVGFILARLSHSSLSSFPPSPEEEDEDAGGGDDAEDVGTI